MSKHTPGPWFVDGVYIIRGPKRCVVAKLIDSKEPYETKVANGHMLAAAPAMYALIKDMRQAFYVDGKRKALLAVMERSHDVVAQAEGRQPQP